MIYGRFKDLELSSLGFGLMRLPETEPNGPIDEKRATEMVDYAYEHGVNYFDTAYFYHAGESQKFIGKALSRYPRDSFYLANKFPGNFVSIVDGAYKLELGGFKMKDSVYSSAAELFERQLEHCGVDYFDFYMLHNLAESTYDLYTDEDLGIVDYLLEEKKKGRIRHFGFSSHGRPETIERFLNWRDCFEYAQIQLNYLDWSLQDADKKYEILTERGVPVIVMEPVRGGKLTNPGQDAAALLKAARPNDTPAVWAFRFLQSLPNIPVVLSGMSTMEQLKENIEIFGRIEPITDSEKGVLQRVVGTMSEFVPCTACRYCCGVCPQTLDIPLLLSTYNEAFYDDVLDSKVSWYVDDLMSALSDDEKPHACTACGTCGPVCPQNIDISGALAKFAALLAKKEEPQ